MINGHISADREFLVYAPSLKVQFVGFHRENKLHGWAVNMKLFHIWCVFMDGIDVGQVFILCCK